MSNTPKILYTLTDEAPSSTTASPRFKVSGSVTFL